MNQLFETDLNLDCNKIEFERISIEVILIRLSEQKYSQSSQYSFKHRNHIQL